MSDLLKKTVSVYIFDALADERVQGRVIGKHCDLNDVWLIRIKPDNGKEVILSYHRDHIKVVEKRYAAWGVCGGKIVVGDTKDNEPYARNSFAKHFGQEPEGVITQED